MSVWRISDQTTSIFGNSYFINIQSTIANTWVNHKDTSDINVPVNQVANYGVDTFFQLIKQVGEEVILLLQSYYSLLVYTRYLKLNASVVIQGRCNVSLPASYCASNPSSIVWYNELSYQGSWTYIYPGFLILFLVLYLFYCRF